jgi:large subunit ribosomal protein L9
MEVILVKPVRKLGIIGQLIKVKNGFARNYLIPKGLAVNCTASNRAFIECKKQEFEEKNLEAKTEAEAFVKIIDGKNLIFVKQCTEDGKLFGSVSRKEIATELSTIVTHNISLSQIIIDTPIKLIGISSIEIALHTDVSAYITISVARSQTEALNMFRAYESSISDKIDQIEVMESSIIQTDVAL